MRRLTLGDLKTGLKDLFENRREALDKSVSGRIYAPMIDKKRVDIDALPEVMTAGLPLANDLAAADAEYDALGSAMWHLATAYELHPQVDPAAKEAARTVREAFVPTLADLQLSYAEEVAAAEARQPQLEALAEALDALPVAGGETLASWARAFVDQGGALKALLERRGDYMEIDVDQRRAAGGLRATTIGLLTNFRKALQDEIAAKQSGKIRLDAGVEAEVFGYIDELAKLHEAAE